MLILNDDKNFKRQLIPNSTSSKASRTIGPSSEADVAKNGLDKIRRILMTVADPVAAMKEIQAQASDDLIALQAFQGLDASLPLSCFVFFQFVFFGLLFI